MSGGGPSKGRRLAGRIALVTGASRGIGAAIAVALADEGADLLLTSTREGGCEGTVREVTGMGAVVEVVSGDLAEPATVERIVRVAEERYGRVDLLVNNAGVLLPGTVEDTTDERLARVLAVNVQAPFSLARRLLPGMRERGFGRVVNVSSISGTLGTPRFSAYCASKWALNGLTRAMGEELRGSGVTVCAVLPGSVDTEMLKEAGFTPAMAPDAIAEVVRFLCTSAPEAMQGSLVEAFG